MEAAGGDLLACADAEAETGALLSADRDLSQQQLRREELLAFAVIRASVEEGCV